MNCLHTLPRSSALPLQGFTSSFGKPSYSVSLPTVLNLNISILRPNTILKAISSSTPSSEMDGAKIEEEKSEEYSQNMTGAMGAVLTYRHELGMNYNFIRPDLIVGSCLQSPEDVDKLRAIGVKTIFCLQQDPDLEYFGVDIKEICEYASVCGDIQHLRAPIRDFDGFDLQKRLPVVVGILHKAINSNGGVTYIHCTAGLGRAPAVALAYMFWIQGYKLSEAYNLLMSKRSCFPKLDAIKAATADILTGLKKKPVTLRWYGSKCSLIEVSGLDIGWGRRIPLAFDKAEASWVLHRELPEGHYEYKYIVDGEWTVNKYEPVTSPNQDGHVNNYISVSDSNPNSSGSRIRKRLAGDDPDLTKDERIAIRQFLEACPDEAE